jgi:hypothetical protein
LVTDPATGETREFPSMSKEDAESAHLQGFLIDFK